MSLKANEVEKKVEAKSMLRKTKHHQRSSMV